MKKILFILSGNLSTTPRAVKTILSLKDEYVYKIVLINRAEQWKSKDKELISKYNLDIISINLGRKPLIPWLIATLQEKVANLIYPFLHKNIRINVSASNKASLLLWSMIKTLEKNNFDLIIGHSAGSLYPAWKASKNWNIPFIFDIEDYHPGEFIRFDAKNEKQRREFLMKKLLPKAYALTSASPLIGEYTLNLIGGHPNHTVILNSFPESEFKEPNDLLTYQPNDLTTYPPIAIGANDLSTSGALRLVWFSQKISFGRGLEQLFEALTLLCNSNDLSTYQPINLTLIGDMDPAFNQQIIQPVISTGSITGRLTDACQISDACQVTDACRVTELVEVTVLPPLSQPDLHAELANHDIGLASEFNNTDLNRQLCLTNKIIAYAQAGLFILATDTPAQKQFMEEHTEHGMVCGQNSTDIANSIKDLLDRRLLIKDSKQIRYSKGKGLSWEHEKGKLIKIWNQILK